MVLVVDVGDAANKSSFTSLTIFILFIMRSRILLPIGWLENQTGDDGSEAFSGKR
jgi:hypothetical protein